MVLGSEIKSIDPGLIEKDQSLSLSFFNPETKKQVINTFFEKLNGGGYLLLGHAESLINLSTDFRLCHLKNDLVYVRPIPGEGKDDLWEIAAKAAINAGDRRRGDR